MAFTYGSVTNCKVRNGQTRKEYECRLGYEVQSQSIADNTSVVKLRLQVRSIKSNYNTRGANQTTTIDGSILSANTFDMGDTNTWQTFGERTITVTHNANGKYSASKSGSFTTTVNSSFSEYALKSGSASVTVAPATIPRYATSNQSLNKKTSSSIKMNWSSDSTIDYLWYSKDNGANWTGLSVADATSGTYTISGLSAYTTYNIKTRVRRKDSQLTTDSSSLSVTTYQKTIPSISLSSKTETSIKVTSGANVEVSSTRYRIMKSGESYGSWQISNIFSGLTINTNYTIEVEKLGKASGEYGYATVSITTYNYPYCTSAPDFKIGNDVKLEFYNPLNRTFQIRMWSYESEEFVSDLISTNGTTYNGFSNIKDRLYASIPSNTESKYNIDVYYGDNKEVKTGGKYSINGNERPTFNNFTYEDINEKTLALTGDSQILVNGYSNLKATISVANKAISDYETEIDRYRLNVGSMSSVEEIYKEDEDVTLQINAVNSPSIIVTAIDKRGLSKQVPITATLKAYFKPVIQSLAAIRGNGGVGSRVTLDFNGEWWNDNFGSVDNEIVDVSYYYKKTTETDWVKGTTVISPTANENEFYSTAEVDGPNEDDKGFDVSFAYNIKITVTDKLGTSNEYQTTLGVGTPAIAIYDNKVSIGSKYDEDLGGALQVKGEIVEEGLKVSAEQPKTKEKVWIQKGKNLFNTNNLVSGYRLGSDGMLFADTNYSTTDFILVKPNTTYIVNWTMEIRECVCYYDETGTFISRNVETNPFITPSNCKYIKASTLTSNIYTAQIEQGSTATEHEEYVEKAIYTKNDNGVYEEFLSQSIEYGELQYNSKISSVQINNWVKKGNLIEISLRAKVDSSISNAETLITLPFNSKLASTRVIYTGEQYSIYSPIFAYTSEGLNTLKTAPISSGNYVHVSFVYMTN